MYHPNSEKTLEIFNQITGRNYQPTKKNLASISERLKEYKEEDIFAVIVRQNLEWSNNPVMAVHLCPSTIFRPSNFEKYHNQVLAMKKDPQFYKEHYERTCTPKNNHGAFDKIDKMPL